MTHRLEKDACRNDGTLEPEDMTLHAYARSRSLLFAEQLMPGRHPRGKVGFAHDGMRAATASSTGTARKLRGALRIGLPPIQASASNRNLPDDSGLLSYPRDSHAATMTPRLALVHTASSVTTQAIDASDLQQPSAHQSQYHQEPSTISAASLRASIAEVLLRDAAANDHARYLQPIVQQQPKIASERIFPSIKALFEGVRLGVPTCGTAINSATHAGQLDHTGQAPAEVHPGSYPRGAVIVNADVRSGLPFIKSHFVEEHLAHLRSRADQVLIEHRGLNGSRPQQAIAEQPHPSNVEPNARGSAFPDLLTSGVLDFAHSKSSRTFDGDQLDESSYMDSILAKILTIRSDLVNAQDNRPITVRAPNPRMRMSS